MTETTIRVGQIYRHCAHGGPHIRITSYTPGQARAQVVDAVTGRNARSLLVRQLHESPITDTGRHRRAGYVLERRRDVLERLSAEQARDEAPMTNNDDGTLWEESEWRVQELFPSGWGAVKSSHDRNEALARMANLRARYTDTQYRLVRRTTTETVDTESDQ